MKKSGTAWMKGTISETKFMLDDMHKSKIDMADGIYVVNPGGYIGDSTWAEICYARMTKKDIRFLEPIDEALIDNKVHFHIKEKRYVGMCDNETVMNTEEVVEEVVENTGIETEPLFEEQVDFDTFSKSDFRAVKVKGCVAVPKSKKLLHFTLDDGTGTDRTILSGIHAFYEPEELVGKTLLAITNLPPRAMMGIDSCGMLLSAIHTENGEEKLNLVMLDDAIPAGAKLY